MSPPMPGPCAQALSRKLARTLAVLSAGLVFTACGGGGGGGGTLTVSMFYSGDAQLFRASNITPTIAGLDGHAPNCSLASGTMPAGMTLAANCAITGTPVEAGAFPIVVRLGAADVSNKLDWSTTVNVVGPAVSYALPPTLAVGGSYDLVPVNAISWTPTVADALSYSVAEGMLPPGLLVDRVTGHIIGTPTAAGSFSFRIAVQVVNAGRTATVVQQLPNSVTVNAPSIPYNFSQGYAALSFSMGPVLPAGGSSYRFSAATLPPGLSIDATTGVISGTPKKLGDGTYRIDIAASTAAGGSFTASTDVFLSVRSPVNINWPLPSGTRGQPFTNIPYYSQNVSDPLTGITYAYALDPASALPPGLVLDPATGAITGTPTTAGAYLPRINVTITLYGTTFVWPLDLAITIT